MVSEQSTENQLSRRRFLSLSSATAATLGIAPFVGNAANSLAEDSTSSDDYYAKLGVEKIINAAGTYTYLTAACMPPQVQRAVAQAALHPVRLKDLQLAAGEYLAKKLRCEAAVVTCGASAALTLATAACVASANGASPQEIPENVDKMKNEVVVQKAHRYEYDHAMLLCGVRIKEVVTLEDYKRPLGPNVVMTNFFNSAEPGPNGAQIDRETWLSVAHEHGVPCHNDAAADMPPIENLWKYTGMGFDLVCFSGGKGIRGPQNAGLLLGKKHLTDLAQQNNNPEEGVGRGMKVAKEQIVGMVAAVDWVLSHTEESMQGDYQKRADLIAASVKGIPSVTAETVVPRIANHGPHLLIRFDPSVTGITTGQIVAKLRDGTPSIELNPNTGQPPNQGIPSNANTLVVGVWMLQPGEDAVVGRRIREALTSKA